MNENDTALKKGTTAVKRSINKVAFIDQVTDTNMLIADDDVDSVQHLDLSVIGDNLPEDPSRSAFYTLNQKADSERKQI